MNDLDNRRQLRKHTQRANMMAELRGTPAGCQYAKLVYYGDQGTDELLADLMNFPDWKQRDERNDDDH